MTDRTTDGEAWFYANGGQRKGPVQVDELRELLAARTIDGETPIWCKGLPDWQPLRTTEVGMQLKDTPPPIAPNHLNNGLVWALAVAPIAYVLVDIAILGYQISDQTFSSALTWVIPALVNGSLCLFDEQQLKRAGYSSGWMTAFALLLAPVYLFMRAQRLRQTPTYGYVWIGSLVASIILRAI